MVDLSRKGFPACEVAMCSCSCLNALSTTSQLRPGRGAQQPTSPDKAKHDLELGMSLSSLHDRLGVGDLDGYRLLEQHMLRFSGKPAPEKGSWIPGRCSPSPFL